MNEKSAVQTSTQGNNNIVYSSIVKTRFVLIVTDSAPGPLSVTFRQPRIPKVTDFPAEDPNLKLSIASWKFFKIRSA